MLDFVGESRSYNFDRVRKPSFSSSSPSSCRYMFQKSIPESVESAHLLDSDTRYSSQSFSSSDSSSVGGASGPWTATTTSLSSFSENNIWKPSTKQFDSRLTSCKPDKESSSHSFRPTSYQSRYLSKWNSEPINGSSPLSSSKQAFSESSLNSHSSIWSPRPQVAIGSKLLTEKTYQDHLIDTSDFRPSLSHSLSNTCCCKYQTFNGNPDNRQSSLVLARYFVIKSYSESDVYKSFLHGVWTSTELGNRRLDAAFRECQKYNASIFLFFSVNSSGQFCGVAEMTSPVDYNQSSGIWQQEKWKSLFNVKWIFVNDIPNIQFRHLLVQNNENKPVTNSRDTQELLPYIGIEMLNIFRNGKK